MRLLDTDGTYSVDMNKDIWTNLGKKKLKDGVMNKYDLRIDSLKLLIQDPVSGPGHYIFLPRGAIIFNLIKQYIYNLYADIECFFIEAPILTDYEHPAVANHVNRSGERTYHTKTSGKHLVTKIGVLYSQLELVSKNGLSSRHQPLKLFEITKCCRLEEHFVPLRRSCEFTMVDMHELFNSLEESLAGSLRVHQIILQLAAAFNLEFHCTYKITEDFLKNNFDWVLQLIRLHDKEALLLYTDPNKKRPINVEYHFDIGGGSPLEVSAFQLDYDNPTKFNIVKEDGSVPILLHANIIGSIERFTYAILTRVIDAGFFPIWLAPEQIRFIPDTADDLELCNKFASLLKMESLRVTIDDRQYYSAFQRFAFAKDCMIPAIVKVQQNKASFLHISSDNNGREFNVEEFIKQVKLETKGYPSMRATYPSRLSLWPEYFY